MLLRMTNSALCRTALFVVCFLVSMSSSWAGKGGSGHSGGGQGVIYPDGRVRFVDLLETRDLPARPVSESEIKKLFFSKDRFQKSIGKKKVGFFNCAANRLKNLGVPSLKEFALKLKDVPVYDVEMRFAKIDGSLPTSYLSIMADSSGRIPSEYQEPLAAFNHGELWLARRFVENLPEEDLCALAVHEAFRVLENSGFLAANLKTADIESLTRWTMNVEPAFETTAKTLLISTRERNGNAVHAQLSKGIEELRALIPSLPSALPLSKFEASLDIASLRELIGSVQKQLNAYPTSSSLGMALIVLEKMESTLTNQVLSDSVHSFQVNLRVALGHMNDFGTALSLAKDIVLERKLDGSKYWDSWKSAYVTIP